jgi:Magnesium chelatase, subunit ChlI
MLARRLTTILPAMTLAESIETTRIHRVAGHTGTHIALVTAHPCRAQPDTISAGRLIGAEASTPSILSDTPLSFPATLARLALGALEGLDTARRLRYLHRTPSARVRPTTGHCAIGPWTGMCGGSRLRSPGLMRRCLRDGACAPGTPACGGNIGVQPLKLGGIGVGQMGMAHTRTMPPLEEVRVVAVADVDVARARAVGGRAGECHLAGQLHPARGQLAAQSPAPCAAPAPTAAGDGGAGRRGRPARLSKDG